MKRCLAVLCLLLLGCFLHGKRFQVFSMKMNKGVSSNNNNNFVILMKGVPKYSHVIFMLVVKMELKKKRKVN